MSNSGNRFLDPKVLATINGLQLVAKTVVDGFLIGANRSFKIGAGMEFNQYRSYQPGDDLKQLDWKMFSRSDRYYIRESHVETSITVRFVIDASRSMAHIDKGVSKFNYAKFIAASLGYLAHKQGDALGLYALNEGDIVNLNPRRGSQHFHSFINALETMTSKGKWPEKSYLGDIYARAQTRELIIFITDLFEEKDELSSVLKKLNTLKNEVIVFHLMGRQELDFDFKGDVIFEDLETGKRIEANSSKIRQEYLVNMGAFLDEKKRQFLENQISYHLQTIDQPLDEVLYKFLTFRFKSF